MACKVREIAETREISMLSKNEGSDEVIDRQGAKMK